MNDDIFEKRFDVMLRDTDVNFFNLQVKVAGLVSALLKVQVGCEFVLDLSLTIMQNDEYSCVRCLKIYIDPEDDAVKILAAGKAGPVNWEEIDITAQYRLAQHLYIHTISGSLYRACTTRSAAC